MKINVSFTTMLFMVFLVLKLTGTIDWSWIWVTCPLWIPFAIFFGILGIIAVGFVVVIATILIVYGIVLAWEKIFG